MTDFTEILFFFLRFSRFYKKKLARFSFLNIWKQCSKDFLSNLCIVQKCLNTIASLKSIFKAKHEQFDGKLIANFVIFVTILHDYLEKLWRYFNFDKVKVQYVGNFPSNTSLESYLCTVFTEPKSVF